MCPVCGYLYLNEPPVDNQGCASFEICPCCGTEFGYNDANVSHDALRMRWLQSGALWFSKATLPPDGWSAENQLRNAGLNTH